MEQTVRSAMSASEGRARRFFSGSLPSFDGAQDTVGSLQTTVAITRTNASLGTVRQRAGRICLGLVCLLILTAPAAADDELSSEACLACHAVEDFRGPKQEPLFINGEAYNASVHAPLPCTACHTDATAIPHEPLKKVGIASCATCHADTVAAYQKSVHGRARAYGFGEAATCTDCHGNIHAVTPHTEPASPAHWSKMAATCAHCHANVEMAEKFQIPVVRPAEAYLQSAHARAVAAGRHAAVCSDCHGAHDILPANDPQSSIWRANVPQTCGRCHAKILIDYRSSVHGEALARGVTDAPVCTDCHGEHRILSPSEPTSPVFAANIPGETCGRCHADARLSQRYGLPGGQVSAFEDSFHGLALRSGKLTVANCSSCHGVHDIRPSSDPRSHVSPENRAQTCGKCHPGAGTRFKIGSVHNGPGTQPTTGSWLVGWVRFAYLWLIGLTIGGMAVHNLFDLSRKARRPPVLPPPLPDGLPERMNRGLRWQHGMMMLSFPVLVYTGFALKFPDGWWAQPLLQFETQLGLRGIIHRAAAVLMLAGLGWHLGNLVVSRRLRACMRGILPSRRDAGAALGTLAYYVHLRPHPPHSGKFNYGEKAEYWAFMWGTTVMGITGFLLWFENTTLEDLPSWTADVATALHFYEAILATLAILVWHFYWVIFDPDVYPMDWSWWDGYPPATRVMERMEPDDAGEADDSTS
jgi:cytochrome b subunit of formate dehydrogenase